MWFRSCSIFQGNWLFFNSSEQAKWWLRPQLDSSWTVTSISLSVLTTHRIKFCKFAVNSSGQFYASDPTHCTNLIYVSVSRIISGTRGFHVIWVTAVRRTRRRYEERGDQWPCTSADTTTPISSRVLNSLATRDIVPIVPMSSLL